MLTGIWSLCHPKALSSGQHGNIDERIRKSMLDKWEKLVHTHVWLQMLGRRISAFSVDRLQGLVAGNPRCKGREDAFNFPSSQGHSQGHLASFSIFFYFSSLHSSSWVFKSSLFSLLLFHLLLMKRTVALACFKFGLQTSSVRKTANLLKMQIMRPTQTYWIRSSGVRTSNLWPFSHSPFYPSQPSVP